MRSNCLILFGVCFLVYFIIDWFFSDAFLYLIGGAIGSTTKGIFNTSNPILVFFIWAVLLAIFIFIYNRLSPNKVFDVIFILTIALLLNIVNALVYEFMSIKGEWSGYLHLGIAVLSKSLLLSLVICSKQGWLKGLL